MAELYFSDGDDINFSIEDFNFSIEDISVSIPRGGPIYVRDMVGPLTKTSYFEASVIEELENLRSEVCVDSSDIPDEDLCVDELKIIAEEELVSKAFEEAFKDVGETSDALETSGPQPDTERHNDGRLTSSEQACSEASGITQAALVPCETTLVRTDDNGELGKDVSLKKKKKRGRRVTVRNQPAEKETYYEKVAQLAMIKQKQEEDKAAACLHSFNGGVGVNEKVNVPNGTEKMEALKSTSRVVKVKQSNFLEYVPVTHPEIVLCVEVYHSKRTSQKTREFLVLGCQPLSDLRDCIHCSTDGLMMKAEQYDPSGYFLIEEVFYNDLREPSAIDYSEPIFDWLKNSENEALKKWQSILAGNLQSKEKAFLSTVSNTKKLPRFKAADMHKSRFCDLQFRLGAGYLYCHQGDCKHLIVIRDMRLIHQEDVQNQSAYPIITYRAKTRPLKCSVCKIYRAEKVTVDDKWAAESPCYFCKNCYYMLHYQDGALLYDEFSVYNYHHD